MRKTRMNPRRLTLYAGLAVAALALILATHRPPSKIAGPFEGRPELVAATFASAWCSACRILEPKLARVIPDFADAPVAFIEFDFTFGDRPELAALAERYDLVEAYERNRGATGFTLLVDRDTGEIVDILTMNFSEAGIREAISAALARAAAGRFLVHHKDGPRGVPPVANGRRLVRRATLMVRLVRFATCRTKGAIRAREQGR